MTASVLEETTKTRRRLFLEVATTSTDNKK